MLAQVCREALAGMADAGRNARLGGAKRVQAAGCVMAWIESHQALGHHPKTLRLASGLHSGVPGAVGYLHLLWYWALDYAPDGVITSDKLEAAARACMWTRRSERFWAAMLSAKFVDEAEEGVRIHDWHDYAGRLVERRRADAERKRVQRKSGGHPRDVQDPSGVPYTTGPDRTVGTSAGGNSPRVTRARARGSDSLQPLGTHLPEDVRERLARPPIAVPGSPSTDRPTNHQNSLNQDEEMTTRAHG